MDKQKQRMLRNCIRDKNSLQSNGVKQEAATSLSICIVLSSVQNMNYLGAMFTTTLEGEQLLNTPIAARELWERNSLPGELRNSWQNWDMNKSWFAAQSLSHNTTTYSSCVNTRGQEDFPLHFAEAKGIRQEKAGPNRNTFFLLLFGHVQAEMSKISRGVTPSKK